MKRALYAVLVLVLIVAATLAPREAAAFEMPLECLRLLVPGGKNHPGHVTACAMQVYAMWHEWDSWGPDWPPFDW